MDVNQFNPPTAPAAPGAHAGRLTWRQWSWRRWALIVGGALGAALFALVVALPIVKALLFPTGCTIDAAGCTLARQWSETISRLGIEPVFPPEEDLHVGDVFVVLTSIAGHENHDPILSKSVKIAHLDLTPAMQEVYRQLPVFPGWPAPPSLAEAAVPDGTDIFQGAWPRSHLPLVAFPALTIQHAQSLDGNWGWLSRALSGSHTADDTETIELIDTASYGVPALYATQALENFCQFAQEVCSEDGARRMVSYVVGTKYALGLRSNGLPVNEVALYIVDRVYLAHTIRQHRGNETTDGAGGTVSAEQHAAAKVSGQSSFGLNQSFSRPVAFGFRAVHVLPVHAGHKPGQQSDLFTTLPVILRHAVESSGLITAPKPLTQDSAPTPGPVAASPSPPPAAAAPATSASTPCQTSGIAPILCRSLHSTMLPPVYGNTQAISPDSRRFFEGEHVEGAKPSSETPPMP